MIDTKYFFFFVSVAQFFFIVLLRPFNVEVILQKLRLVADDSDRVLDANLLELLVESSRYNVEESECHHGRGSKFQNPELDKIFTVK